MTETNPAGFAGTLTEAEQHAWRYAEAANDAEALKWLEGRTAPTVREVLLVVLAAQNAGNGRAASNLLERLGQGMSAAETVWRKAETQIAARRESLAELAPGTGIESRDLDTLADDLSALAELVRGRGHIALGLARLQDSRYDEAERHFAASVDAMRAASCQSGLASALTELGKVHAWRGELQDAHAYLLEALGIWQSLNGGMADAVWHEIGATLLDSGRPAVAAGILERTFERNQSERTRHAFVRALVASEEWDRADAAAQAAVQSVTAEATRLARENGGEPDRYREYMLLRELGVIQASRFLLGGRGNEAEAREAAERYLRAAVSAFDPAFRFDTPIFTAWIGNMDREGRLLASGRMEDDLSGIGFDQLRLVQLELLIQSFDAPAEAAIGFAKVADVFSRRAEPVLEIEARDQSARAHLRAGNAVLATRQLNLALRLAAERGLVEKATSLRRKLFDLLSHGTWADFAVDGFLPNRLVRRESGYDIVGAVTVYDGRPVLIHRIGISKSGGDLSSHLDTLQALSGHGRGHRGLPRLMKAAALGNHHVNLVTEQIDGEPLLSVMRAEPTNVSKAVHMIRDLSEAVQLLHNAGFTACEPTIDDVIVERGDNPVFLDFAFVGAKPSHRKKSDTVYLAEMLIDWLTEGRGAATRHWYDVLLGRFPYNSLQFASARKQVPDGMIHLLNGIVSGRDASKLSPGNFAAELQAFI